MKTNPALVPHQWPIYSLLSVQMKFCIFLILTIFSGTMGAAQHPPKIGLTLSGGGAKGLAHIGILKAIDSAGLHIDLVTGTSMGSIVGGLYAAGYSADSIEKMARAIDWRILLSNNVSMRSYSMEEKSEYGKYAAELTLGNGKISLPTGFLESQELWLKLQELFFPVATIKDFDKLPKSFRCIATDLATGEAVVHAKGDIVTAIRSSMAIPGVFSSVDIQGKRYVDGGVVRNFPVKDAIALGATYTIGVSVSSPLKNVNELDNAFKILTQVVFLNENKDRIEESALCNLLIDVPMNDYTSGSFNRSNEIIDLGIETGRLYYPYFKKLADSLNHHQIKNALNDAPLQKEIKINRIAINGLRPAMRESLYDQLNLPLPGVYTASGITESIRNAFASRMYKKITYTMEADGTTGFTLTAKAVPEPVASIKAGLHYNIFTGFSVIGNLTLRNFFTASSRSMVSLNIGENFRGLLEHLQLFGYKNPWSNKTQFYAEQQDLPFKENFKQSGGYSLRYFKIDNQFLNSARRRWSGGFGAKWEYISLDPTIERGEYFSGHNQYLNLYGITTYNSFERPYFPRKGFKSEFQVGYVLGLNPDLTLFANGQRIGNIDEIGITYGNYLRSTLDITRVLPLSSQWASVTQLQSSINFGTNTSLLNNFIVGGMSNVMRNQITFAGLREGDILTESAIALKTGFRLNIMNDAYFTLSGNVMHYDFIKKNLEDRPPGWIGGAGFTMGYNLPIGPFEYTVMYGGNGAGWASYLNFGVPFR